MKKFTYSYSIDGTKDNYGSDERRNFKDALYHLHNEYRYIEDNPRERHMRFGDRVKISLDRYDEENDEVESVYHYSRTYTWNGFRFIQK